MFEQKFTEVKHRRKNYVFQIIVSCLYDHHAVLQFKEITYIYKQVKEWYKERVLLQTNMENNDGKVLRYHR